MIAHIDADSFFASVLVRKNPHLAGKPLLALGMGGGCVIAASYEAKAFGVKTGMRLKDALALVPHAIRMSADFHEAAMGSTEIENILGETCSCMEQMSIDEWYVDLGSIVGGMPKDLTAWALQMQAQILKRTALSVSIGVGPSKLLAKMAGEYKKPAGVTVLEESIACEDFLKDRPAAAIPGIGHKRMIHTDANGWKTAWDITQAPSDMLIKLFGRPGEDMKRELLGEELSAVSGEEEPPKSVSRCRSFRPTSDRAILWGHVLKHLEYIVAKMRRHQLACKGFSVWLRESAQNDFAFAGANASLAQPAETLDAILPVLQKRFAHLHHSGIQYTQVGLALWHLVPSGPAQFSLFEKPMTLVHNEAIQKSLDLLHERFGRNAITRGSALVVKTGTKQRLDVTVYE